MNWLEVLGWHEEELQDIRFVGYSYIKQGLYATAIELFEGLYVLSSDNFYDLQTLGALYLQINKPLQSLEFLDKALQIKPDDSSTLLNKVKVLFALGYRKQAVNLAKKLQGSSDENIAQYANALLLTFSLSSY